MQKKSIMKIIRLTVIISIVINIVANITHYNTAEAYETNYLKAEVFTIPDYKSKIPANSFTGIGVDGKTGNVSLANDSGWCEIPYRNGQFNFKASFIAPTKGYKLKAVASSPHGVYVFDVLSNSILGDRGNYKISVRINNPTGMAYHNGKVYVADQSISKIYELKLSNGQAKLLKTLNAHSGICGLTSDGRFLYSCNINNIYKYDSDMNITVVYKLNVSIAGITSSDSSVILAVAKNKNKIYRFKL